MCSKLYVIVRNDLPSLNPGKAMAQVCHAGTQMMCNTKQTPFLKDWLKEGDGFGTTIVLSASLEQINKLKETYKLNDIIDPTYPFKCQWEMLQFVTDDVKKKNNILVSAYEKPNQYGEVFATRKEHTCSYIFMDDDFKSESFKTLCDNMDIGLYR